MRSRALHADLHAELHLNENSRRIDSTPQIARPAQFSFSWRDHSPKNLKSTCSSRHKSAKPSCRRCWRREWDLNPRAPKGHRLTGEPIPDMGPRATQTARYQAPESRLISQTFQRLFSLLGRPLQNSSRQSAHRKKLGQEFMLGSDK